MMKILNFKAVHSVGDQQSQHDVILLHPFGSSRDGTKLYRDALENLLDRIPTMDDEEAKINAYCCSFDGNQVLTGKTSIPAISKKLMTKLRRKRPLPEDSSPAHSSKTSTIGRAGGEEATTAISTTKGRPQREQPALIFITHSLGSLVVRHMLTQLNEPTASIFDTVGMILLDDVDEDLDSTNDEKYLSALWDMVSPQQTRPRIDLSSILRDFPSSESPLLNSDYIRNERRKDNRPETLIQSKFNVWITKNVSGEDNRVLARKKRILSWVNERIRKIHIAKEVRDEKNIPNMLKRSDIDNAIKDLLSQPRSARDSERPLPQRRRDAEPRDDSVYESLSDPDLIAPNLTSHMTPTRTQPSPFRIPHRRWSESANSIATRSIMSEDERISVGSYPTVIPNNTSDDNLKQTIDLGKSFLKKGELKSAETAFIRCQRILELLEHHQKVRYGIEIRAQLAGIKLFRGTYKEAQEDFEAVLGDMAHGFNRREQNVVKRWIATALLHQGQYKQAAESFDFILESIHAQDPTDIMTEIPVRRDLALAYAYQGDYQQALKEIGASQECLKGARRELNMTLPELLPRFGKTDESLSTENSEAPTPQVSISIDQTQKSNHHKPLDLKVLNELSAKKDHLYLTESKIRYMWGDFEVALKFSEKALHGMKKRWGARHLKTLECASHHSILLAFNSRIFEAETACNLTLVETRRELGSRHPQTLETMGHLVSIFQFQARLVEAGDTAKSLAKTTESSLTAHHPQTHRSRCLVAETLLAVGDYVSTETELEGIINGANKVYRKNHPDTLRYQSRLALAKYYTGKLQEAEELAIYVLREQRSIYTIPKSNPTRPEKTHDRLTFRSPIQTLLEYQGALNDLLGSINSNSDDLRIHPCLLQTLRTIALIAKQNENLGTLAFRIFLAIWKWNKSSLGRTSIFTVDSQYDLALAYREKAEGLDGDSDSSLQEAVKHLRLVYQKRFSILGPKHPGTVSARRELITTNCTIGRWEPPLDAPETEDADNATEEVTDYNKGSGPLDDTTWGPLEVESHEIVYLHEGLVGKYHPETMKSLLWLFTVQILLRKEKGVNETLHKGLERFRHPSVRHERFIESLNLEQKFALAMSDLGDKYEAKALQILRETSRTIEESLETKRGSLQTSTEMLKRSVENEIDTLFFKVSRHSKKWEAELQAQIELAEKEKSYHKATIHQAELWSLLVALHKHDDPRTLDARIRLAEFQLRSVEHHGKKEGLQILRELTTKYSKALTPNQRQRIDEAMRSAVDNIPL